MRKKPVYVCSPCRGDYEHNLQRAREYCREIALEHPDVVPVAPHIYLTQFLDDTVPEERALGLGLDIDLLKLCEEIWVYGADNPSEGMQAEIEYARRVGILVREV